MTDAAQLLTLNLIEVRRRSLIVWQAIPNERLGWRCDIEAMSLGESIRHVWVSTGNYMAILKARKSVEAITPNSEMPIESVQQEIKFAEQIFDEFLVFIEKLDVVDLIDPIDRSDIGYTRQMGDFVLRIAYHEAVHAGQLLQSMRTADITRPDIWD